MQKPLPSDAFETDQLPTSLPALCGVEFTHKYTAITVSWKSSFVKSISNYMLYYTVGHLNLILRT